MQCEADEKIHRALRHQIRVNKEVFQLEDSFLQTRWEQQVKQQVKLFFRIIELFLCEMGEHIYKQAC